MYICMYVCNVMYICMYPIYDCQVLLLTNPSAGDVDLDNDLWDPSWGAHKDVIT